MDKVDLTVGIVAFKTRMKTVRTGICTQWLSKLLGVVTLV